MIIRIVKAGQSKDLNESDLPVAIGTSPEKGVEFDPTVETEAVAWLRFEDPHLFLDATGSSGCVQLNGKTLDGPQQLNAGDQIDINNTRFLVEEETGVIVLSEIQTEPAGAPEFAPLPGKKVRPAIRNAVIGGFVFLFLGVVYVLSAASVRLVVTPEPDSLSLRGFPPAFKVGDSYLALPGRYRAVAKKDGFRMLKETVVVTFGSDATHNYELQKLPGLLDVLSSPVDGAEVQVDGNTIGVTPLSSYEIEAGAHQIELTAPRYLPFTQSIEIAGSGERQTVKADLKPDWGTLEVDSRPQGAKVTLNGKSFGATPLTVKMTGSDHTIELHKEGWRSVRERITIEPGQTTKLPLFELKRVDGKIKITSTPADARIMLNSEFMGNTPMTVSVESEKDHQVSVLKNGFVTATRSLKVEKNKELDVNFMLEPEYGTVFIMARPADAVLTVDGQTMEGPATRRLRLSTVAHKITVTKPGYQPFTTTITPTSGLSKRINAELISDRVIRIGKDQPEIKTAQGQALRRIRITKPVKFEMGASRREAGRRSNETQYTVQLTRTFDISVNEVTNAEFQEFAGGHDSGNESGFDLNEDGQPVASVTWDQAARYLNWLSNKDGLTPVYEEKDGRMTARMPISDGYRFPTEAEWAFVARYEGQSGEDMTPAKYPWGDNLKSAEKGGNYADLSASLIVPVAIRDYDDGYETSSPVGTFKANALGIYDLGGNAAEWCHDYYDIYGGAQPDTYADPTGPTEGEHHVIRGASWRHGSITELRWTYRDYSNKPRNDVGFRIARYSDEQSDN